MNNMKKKIFVFICFFIMLFISGNFLKSFAAPGDHATDRKAKKGTLELVWNEKCKAAGGQCVIKEFFEREKATLKLFEPNIECKGERNLENGAIIKEDESSRFVCVKNDTDKKLCNRCSNSEGCMRTSFYIGNTINKDGSTGDVISSTSCDDKADPTRDSTGKASKESIEDVTCPRMLKEDGKTDADPNNAGVNKRCTNKPATETGCQSGENCVKTVDEKTQTKTGKSCFITEGTSKVVAFCIKPKTGTSDNSNSCTSKKGTCAASCSGDASLLSGVTCPVAGQVCCQVPQQGKNPGTTQQCQCQASTMACQGRNTGPGACGANMISCCTTVSNDPMQQLASTLGKLFDRMINPSSSPRSGTGSTSMFPTSTPFLAMSPTPIPTSGGLNGPNGVDTTFNIKLKFNGIDQTKGSVSPKVRVTLVDSSATTATAKTAVQEADFTSSNDGVFSGSVTFTKVEPKSTYYLLIKGPKHVQKKICSNSPTETYPGGYVCTNLLTVTSGTNDINLSNIYLMAGDVPVQDGVVNSQDFGNVRTRFGKADYSSLEVADLNFDGVVNSQDFSLVTQTLQTTDGADQK
jgi:hypothetical protein